MNCSDMIVEKLREEGDGSGNRGRFGMRNGEVEEANDKIELTGR